MVHEGKKPFKCDICDYSCSLKSTMKTHVESVHEKKKPFECKICDFSCSQKGKLKYMLHQFMREKSHLNVKSVTTAVL